MKQNSTFHFIFFCLISYMMFSCKKENINSLSDISLKDSTTLKKVIAWLDKKKINARSMDSSVDYLKQNLIGSELWAEKFNDRERLIIIPLKDAFKARNTSSQKSYKNLVLIENDKGEYRVGNVVEIIPQNQPFNKIPENLISQVYNNKGNNLNGIFSILTLSNSLVYELEYNKGKISSTKYLEQKNKKSTGKIYSSRTTGEPCMNWYLVTTWYNPDGSTTKTEQFVGTTGDCAGEWQDMQPGDSGSGDGKITLVTVDSVINNLDSSCFIQFVNQIGDARLKNEIAKLYQQTFVGYGSHFNIRYEQQSNLMFNGQSVASYSFADPSNPNTWVIRLNTDWSSIGTQEAWGQAILHELIHGFIDQNNLDFISTTTWQQAHADMLNNWIIEIRDAMMEIYQMPQYDATAIAFQGLDDILKTRGVSPTFKQNMVDWVFAHYNINLPDAEATVDQYFSGTKGTKCH